MLNDTIDIDRVRRSASFGGNSDGAKVVNMDVWYATTLWLALISGWIDPASGRRTRYNPSGSIIVRPVVPPSVLVPPSTKPRYYYGPGRPIQPIFHQTDFGESGPRFWRSIREPWEAENFPNDFGHKVLRSAPLQYGSSEIFDKQNNFAPSFPQMKKRSSYSTMPIFNMDEIGSQSNPYTISSLGSKTIANPYLMGGNRPENRDSSYAPLSLDSTGVRNEYLNMGQLPALRLLSTGEHDSEPAQLNSNPPQDELEDIWKDFYGSRLKPNIAKPANTLPRINEFSDKRPSSAYELLTPYHQQNTEFQPRGENRNNFYPAQDSRFDPNEDPANQFSGQLPNLGMPESRNTDSIQNAFKLGPPISPETIQGQVVEDEYSQPQRKVDDAGESRFFAPGQMQQGSSPMSFSTNSFPEQSDGLIQSSQRFQPNEYSRSNLDLRDFNEDSQSSYGSASWPNQMQNMQTTVLDDDFSGQRMRRQRRSEIDYYPEQYPDDING